MSRNTSRTLPAIAAAVLLALAAISTASAKTSPACPPPAHSAIAGLYTLRGVMEMGSQIRLRADGRFEYMLAYGALDEIAEGCWTRINDVVILTPSRMEVSRGGTKFDRLTLPVVDGGKLARRFGERMVGFYERGR